MANPDRLIRDHMRERYWVTLTSGETFDGLLIDLDASHLVLADAEQIASNGHRLKAEGHVWLPRINVAYMQRPRP